MLRPAMPRQASLAPDPVELAQALLVCLLLASVVLVAIYIELLALWIASHVIWLVLSWIGLQDFFMKSRRRKNG